MKNRKIFIIIQDDSDGEAFDYPDDIPIPRTGDAVIFNDLCGTVSAVRHMTAGSISEIRILINTI